MNQCFNQKIRGYPQSNAKFPTPSRFHQTRFNDPRTEQSPCSNKWWMKRRQISYADNFCLPEFTPRGPNLFHSKPNIKAQCMQKMMHRKKLLNGFGRFGKDQMFRSPFCGGRCFGRSLNNGKREGFGSKKCWKRGSCFGME
jgi:hypothetical protein